jgi:hypothetical protein
MLNIPLRRRECRSLRPDRPGERRMAPAVSHGGPRPAWLRETRPAMNIAPRLALVGLLLTAGCAASGNSSDNDRNGSGFYGGVTGGNRP